MSDNVRTISTNCFGRLAYDILHSVNGQLSDGIWENSPSMAKYWMFSSVSFNEISGEVTIKISKEPYKNRPGTYKYNVNGFRDMSDLDVLKFYAGKLKAIVKSEERDNKLVLPWKRDNDTELCYFGSDATVANVYSVYDVLLGRKPEVRFDVKALSTETVALIETLQAKYDEAGDKIDDLELQMKAEIKKIEDKFNVKKNKLYALRKSLVERICKLGN